jgi:hypothetical protein
MKPNKISLIMALVAGIFLLSNARVFGQQYTLSPSGNICGTTATLTMSGSQTGVTYQLETSPSTGLLLIGNPVHGTGSALTWTNVPVPSGNEYLVLTNITGASPAGITYLNPTPAIAGNVTSSNVGGGSIKFTVNITQGTAVNYEWFNGGPPILSGASASTYTATAPGNYTVLVISSCGSVRLTCPTVISPGTISPVTQNISPGAMPQILTSSASSGGNGIYSYQWAGSNDQSTWTSVGSGSLSYQPATPNSGGYTYYRLTTTSNGVSLNSNIVSVNAFISSAYSPIDKYVSVNKLTGTANVVIPIYTLKAAHVDFPINLTYSATGIKAADVEGNAGVGWNVTLGGAVTRQLRGLPDDITTDNSGSPRQGWMKTSLGTAIMGYNLQNDNNTSTCLDETNDIYGFIAVNFSNYFDSEPDIFNVNAPGLSCKLIFDSNNQIRTIPYQDLKVTYTTSAQGNADQGQITSFTITNDQGITYTFAAKETTTQKSTSVNLNYYANSCNQYKNGITYYSSWDLTSISDIQNNAVSILYTPGTTAAFSSNVMTSVGGGAGTSLIMYSLLGSTKPQLVSQIQTTSNFAAFNITYIQTPNSSKSCISTISGMGHTVNLVYTSTSSNDLGYQRLFLENVVDQNCLQINNYAPLNLIFQYANTSPGTTDLNSPSSDDIDYWGYSTSLPRVNTTLLPTIEVNPSTTGYERYRLAQAQAVPTSAYAYSLSSGANRLATSNAICGTLSQITYAEGGYTRFSYALNDYYDSTIASLVNPISAVVHGGGIRVTQISDHDGISSDLDNIRTYNYLDQSTGLSSGKPISLPEYAFTIPYGGSNTGAALWESSTVISPIDLSSEDHSILYSTVTETQSGVGSTVYTYTNPAMNWDNSPPSNPSWSPLGLPAWSPTTVDVGRVQQSNTCANIGVLRNDVNTYPFPPNTNYDFERGLLTQVAGYNTSGTEVSESDYTYQTPQTPLDVTAFKFEADAPATNYAKYTIHTSTAPLLTKVVHKIFDLTNLSPGNQSNIAQTVTTTNSYGDAQYKLTQQSISAGDGNTYTTNVKYSKDYTITATDSYSQNIKSLQTANMNIPIEKYEQVTPAGGSGALTTGAELTLYGTFTDPAGFVNLQAPATHLKFVTQSGVNNFLPSGGGSNSFTYDSRYLVAENDFAYDKTGALLSKDDGFNHIQTTIPNSMSNLPRAIITNAKYNEVGVDALYPANSYSFGVPNGNVSQGSGRSSTSVGLSFQAVNTTVTRVLSKSPNANYYYLSLWLNTSQPGTLTVTISNGSTTQTGSYGFLASTTNPTLYPTGWEYCKVKIPVSSFAPSSSLTVSFSTNVTLTIADVLCYPDNANIVTYDYDSNFYKDMETDANGVSNYYNYDPYGRLLYAYDQDKNIIERKTYVTANQQGTVPLFTINNLGGGRMYFAINPSVGSCLFNGNNISYALNYGDGVTQMTYNTSTGFNHTYSNSTHITYSVTLTVSSSSFAPQSYTANVVFP